MCVFGVCVYMHVCNIFVHLCLFVYEWGCVWCLCVYKYVCVIFMSLHTCVFVCVWVSRGLSRGQSIFAVCTLTGLWASGDTYMSTSCLKVGALGLLTQGSMLGFCVGSADLNLGLHTEPLPRPARLLSSLCQAPAPVLCFLHWQRFRGRIHEQLWLQVPQTPGAPFLSPHLVGYQLLVLFFNQNKIILQ